MIRREVYRSIGGHAALKAAVVDDVGLTHRIRSDGNRTTAVRADHLISLRMYHGLGEIVEGFTKNIFSAMNRSYVAIVIGAVTGVLFHVFPYAHWIITGSMVSLLTVVLITLSRLLLFRSLGHPMLYALFAHPLMVPMWTVISLRSAWQTGIRRRVTWRGRHYDAEVTTFGADR